MVSLVFGVKQLAYGHAKGMSNPNTTTVDVARILEKKYGVMAKFYELHQTEIHTEIGDKLADVMIDALAGYPVNLHGLRDMSAVKPLFTQAIINKEFDGKIAGVATAASLAGVNHRKKLKGKKGKRKKAVRPSFLDTHLYKNSFVCWIDL